MYALNLAADGRVLSASLASFAPAGAVMISYLPDGDISEYRYVNGAYVYEPVAKVDPSTDVATSEVTTADMAAAIQEGVNAV